MNTYIKTDHFSNYKKILDEANQLIEENTIDSLLRYFQTGNIKKDGIHLPSLLLDSLEVEQKLADKMEPILNELGFNWNKERLDKEGKLVIEYKQGEYTLQFATLDPYKRTLRYHFDFVEMEREREIKLSKVKHKIKETKERYLDIKNYISDNKGFKKIKQAKMIKRLEGNIETIVEEISQFEDEIKEINEQKLLLEKIRSKTEDIEYQFRRYGLILEYKKGEEYEV